MRACVLSCFSCVQLFVNPQTVAPQAPLSMGFSRQEYWSGLPCLLVSSLTQLCPTLCNPMDCSTPGLPVHHQLQELTQTHVHRVGDTIQPSHPLSSPSLPAFNLQTHQHVAVSGTLLLPQPPSLVFSGSTPSMFCLNDALSVKSFLNSLFCFYFSS